MILVQKSWAVYRINARHLQKVCQGIFLQAIFLGSLENKTVENINRNSTTAAWLASRSDDFQYSLINSQSFFSMLIPK